MTLGGTHPTLGRPQPRTSGGLRDAAASVACRGRRLARVRAPSNELVLRMCPRSSHCRQLAHIPAPPYASDMEPSVALSLARAWASLGAAVAPPRSHLLRCSACRCTRPTAKRVRCASRSGSTPEGSPKISPLLPERLSRHAAKLTAHAHAAKCATNQRGHANPSGRAPMLSGSHWTIDREPPAEALRCLLPEGRQDLDLDGVGMEAQVLRESGGHRQLDWLPFA